MKALKFIKIITLSFVAYLGHSAFVFAEETVEIATTDSSGWYAIAAAFAIGIAAFGGALGQGKAISAALEGIARNPSATSKIQMPMLIGLAFIESLVIYVLLISFFIVFKF
ncbi:MAG: ATP synthase F0 subunit C [Pseudomonadota bacterium]